MRRVKHVVEKVSGVYTVTEGPQQQEGEYKKEEGWGAAHASRIPPQPGRGTTLSTPIYVYLVVPRFMLIMAGLGTSTTHAFEAKEPLF